MLCAFSSKTMQIVSGEPRSGCCAGVSFKGQTVGVETGLIAFGVLALYTSLHVHVCGAYICLPGVSMLNSCVTNCVAGKVTAHCAAPVGLSHAEFKRAYRSVRVSVRVSPCPYLPILSVWLCISMSVSSPLSVFARLLYFFSSWIDVKTLGDVATV